MYTVLIFLAKLFSRADSTRQHFLAGRVCPKRSNRITPKGKSLKNVANKYLDQALHTFTSDLSKKISLTGGAVDIHKAIGKLSRPARGWTLSGHKYSGPYNDLAVQRSLFAGEV